jgi:hypothetical protein
MSTFGKIRKAVKGAVRTVENFGRGQAGKGPIGADKGGDAAPADRGPQFSEEARRQAAGAGTVGFTQRTQNY